MKLTALFNLSASGRRLLKIVFLSVCIGFAAIFYVLKVETPSPSLDRLLEDALKDSAEYLVKVTHDDGMFEYLTNTNPAVKSRRQYNILRHAGTIYAMSMYQQKYPDDRMLFAIKRAGRYLQNSAIRPLPSVLSISAVWSDPQVNGSRNPMQVKLGGTGLGLVALLSIEKLSPGFTSLPQLRALGRSILYMQRKDGSFYAKYIPSQGGLQGQWTSLYYPGEAALGLLMLYEKDPDPLWLQSAGKALAYLALSRQNSQWVPADHWALLATAKLLSLEQKQAIPVSKAVLIKHALQICESILKEQIREPVSIYQGGFAVDGRTTPTATRLEGLLAVLSFLPEEHALRSKIETAVTQGITFLLSAQIRQGKYRGAIPRAVGKLSGQGPDIQKFNRRSTEIRIDYIQHAMSAMLEYLRLMEKKRLRTPAKHQSQK